MKVLILPAALAELEEAIAYYRMHASAQIGLALADEFNRVIKLISEFPDAGNAWQSDTRRMTMQRFPFDVIYRRNPHHLSIIAIAHQRRRPGYWRQRR